MPNDDPSPESDITSTTDTTDATDTTEDRQGEHLTKDDYALGETSDPDGASRDVPAGEDYAGSGF